MHTQYESVVILNPVLSQQQVEETIDKFRQLIKDGGSDMVFEDNWGMKKLAYPIQKKKTGFYYLFEFTAPSELIAKLETEYKRDERIMRWLTTALEKEAIKYNEKKRNKAKQVEPETESEPTS
ncbi:MAG: 30S ribosomal protein S6 [Flavobacteriaceae bacterium]|nr:30S ribosomal protein S6 [Bacteroidia bacterium]RZW38289.1 MAG: 30S ribosomal protein S6 [Flavobacteriaceae bacterium]